MKVSVIIPVYNEEKTVLEIVKRVKKQRFQKEIIIINDGSLDNTAKRLKTLRSSQIIIYNHQKNLGKGAAIKTGLKKASGDVIVIQDADLEYAPEDLFNLLVPIFKGEADVVYGSRFLGEQHPSLWQYSMYYLGNRFLTHLTRVLYWTKISDLNTGYKIFHKRALRGLKFRSNRFDLDVELTAKVLKRRLRFLEFPISYRGRSREEGKKITWKDGVKASLTLLRYRVSD